MRTPDAVPAPKVLSREQVEDLRTSFEAHVKSGRWYDPKVFEANVTGLLATLDAAQAQVDYSQATVEAMRTQLEADQREKARLVGVAKNIEDRLRDTESDLGYSQGKVGEYAPLVCCASDEPREDCPCSRCACARVRELEAVVRQYEQTIDTRIEVQAATNDRVKALEAELAELRKGRDAAVDAGLTAAASLRVEVEGLRERVRKYYDQDLDVLANQNLGLRARVAQLEAGLQKLRCLRQAIAHMDPDPRVGANVVHTQGGIAMTTFTRAELLAALDLVGDEP